MKLAKGLYTAEGAEELGSVVYALRRDIPMPRLYCIIYVPGKNRIELISSKQLFNGPNPPKDPIIAGVAFGEKTGLELIEFMIKTAVEAGKDPTDPGEWIEAEEYGTDI